MLFSPDSEEPIRNIPHLDKFTPINNRLVESERNAIEKEILEMALHNEICVAGWLGSEGVTKAIKDRLKKMKAGGLE